MKQFFVVLFLSILCFQLLAQSKWGLPNSPTGNVGSALLDAIAHEDNDYRKKFVETKLTEFFRNAFSIEVHLSALNDAHELLGDFELIGVKKTEPLKAELVLQSKDSDNRFRIIYHLEDQEPYRISLMGIVPAASIPRFNDLISLESYLIEQARAGKFSGAIIIVRGDQPLFKKAYGMASKRYQYPNNVNTKFNIGSINKIFTQLAIYQLYEKQKLNLDDPIGRHITGIRDELAKKVTIRHLLDHRSGLGHYWNNVYEARFAKLRTVSDYVDLVKDQPFDFEPGTQQQYSNSGYILLGALIEQVSGMDYYEYVRQNIYSPAGMASSDHYELDRPVENLATGYTNHNPDGSEGEGYKRNNNYFSLKGSPAGGGYSTVDDLWKFDQALKTGLLFSDPRSKAAKELTSNGGLGIAGGGPGTSAILESDWDAGYTVVVLSNYDPPMAVELGLEIMEWLREAKL